MVSWNKAETLLDWTEAADLLKQTWGWSFVKCQLHNFIMWKLTSAKSESEGCITVQAATKGPFAKKENVALAVCVCAGVEFLLQPGGALHQPAQFTVGKFESC